jgi:hypothetical protein
VIRITPGATPAEDRVELGSELLIRNWPRLADWLKLRLGLRSATRCWEQHNKDDASLISGAPLEEALQLRGLNHTEEEFVTASRAHAVRTLKNRRRIRIGLSLLAIGVVFVMMYQHQKRTDNEKIAAVNEKKAAESALQVVTLQNELDGEKARALLASAEKAERVVNCARLVHTLGDYVVAVGEEEDTLARWQWEELETEIRKNARLDKFLNRHAAALKDLLQAKGRKARGLLALGIAHDLRNESLAGQETGVIDLMMSVRAESYRMAARVVGRLVESAAKKKSFEEVRPFVREFWRLYWSSLGMVENQDVSARMVKLSRPLEEWESKGGVASDDVAKSLRDAYGPLLKAFKDDDAPIRPFGE